MRSNNRCPHTQYKQFTGVIFGQKVGVPFHHVSSFSPCTPAPHFPHSIPSLPFYTSQSALKIKPEVLGRREFPA